MLPVGLAKERFSDDLRDFMARTLLHLANRTMRLFSGKITLHLLYESPSKTQVVQAVYHVSVVFI